MQKFESEPESTHFGCMFCQIACRSAGGEGAHMNHTHAEIHPVRKRIGHHPVQRLPDGISYTWEI